MDRNEFFGICAIDSPRLSKILGHEDESIPSRLTQTLDSEFNSCLHYCCRWNLDSTKRLLHTSWCTPELLRHQNSRKETAIMWAAKYRPEVFEYLLDSKFWNSEWLDQVDENGENLLMYCCRYHPKLVSMMAHKRLLSEEDFKVSNNSDQRPLEMVKDQTVRVEILMAMMSI